MKKVDPIPAMSEPANKINELVNAGDDIIGVVDYQYEFYSRFLKNERDIIVWLPLEFILGK